MAKEKVNTGGQGTPSGLTFELLLEQASREHKVSPTLLDEKQAMERRR